jgi:hypothetical protein
MSQIPIPQPEKSVVQATPGLLETYEITGHKMTRLAKAAIHMIGHVVGADGIAEAISSQKIESTRRNYVQTIQQAMGDERLDELDGVTLYRKQVGNSTLLSQDGNIILAHENNHPQTSFKGEPIQTNLIKAYSLRVDDAPSWTGTMNDTPIGSILKVDAVRTANYAYPDGSQVIVPNVIASVVEDPISDLHFARRIADALVVPTAA